MTASLSCPVALSDLTFPPTSCQSSVFTLWLSLLSANPRSQTLPHKLFFLSSPWTVLTDSHLTKTQWKKTTPHFDSCVYRKLLQLLLQKAWGEAEGTCGCLDLHVVRQDASTPPPHSQRQKHQRIWSTHCTNLRTDLSPEGHFQWLCWITIWKVQSLDSGWNRWLRVPVSLHLGLTTIKNPVYCRPSEFLPLFGCGL